MQKHKVKPTLRGAIDGLIRANARITSGTVASAAGVTRQAAHRELSRMVAEGALFPEGAGRSAHYVAKRTAVVLERAREGLAEDALYRELLAELPPLTDLPHRAERILHYAFTEMVNNAIDHSAGSVVRCAVRVDDERVHVSIRDDGVGAFERVRRAFDLAAPIDAIGEISKGKTTTDAERHSGQGIFFTSKAVDAFELASGGLRWMIDNRRGDNAIGAAEPEAGTRVSFEIDRATQRELRALFDEYTTELEFDKTRTVVRLFAYGTSFVSRSEAKRLLSGLERFREVTMDFAGVDAVGQGFADEVFRVWSRGHAGTRIVPVNMIEPVRFMVTRALRST